MREELRRCGVPVFYVPKSKQEVEASCEGRLGGYVFQRAWYYWVVHGPVPIEVAKELYADEVGKTDIRVAGHCGCPPPEAPWISWITPEGRKVAKAYVLTYHIDTELGLYIFVQALKKHGLDKADPPKVRDYSDPERPK
jgi:hypothetical protein